ncbi:MAG: hypothetical protein Q6K90_04010 [Gloeomargarita sp. HHBFW_bins_162]
MFVVTGCGVPQVNVTPGFAPMTLRGRAGGAVNSGICGYIARQPNHRVQVQEDIDYAKLIVLNPRELMVLVNGADGSFCATPIQGQPAQISGYWKAGMYEIFVGRSQPHSSPDYQLLLTQER